MTSTRQRKVKRSVKETVATAFSDFADGMTSTFGADPRLDATTSRQTQRAFATVYPLLEWSRQIKQHPHARMFLAEIHSSSLLSVSIAALGLYEVANAQLRYTLECVLCFLYFKDHPRELGLAQADLDLWDLTRPKAVTKYLRKLPEFSPQIGQTMLSRIDNSYGQLCGYVHPRHPLRMSQKKYLNQISQDTDKANDFGQFAASISSDACGMFWLAFAELYDRKSELTQAILRSSVSANDVRAIQTFMSRR